MLRLNPTALACILCAGLATLPGCAAGHSPAVTTLAGSPLAGSPVAATGEAVSQYADRYLAITFAANPLAGTVAGLHEYDGRAPDLSLAAIAKRRDDLVALRSQLRQLLSQSPSKQDSLHARMLLATIDNDLLSIDVLKDHLRNPMAYTNVVDVTVYTKRDFAPKPQRLASVITVLDGVPAIMAAGKANLSNQLGRVFIETAIESAQGQATFLDGDLIAAFADVQEPALNAKLAQSAAEAATAMRDYAAWLTTEKLPLATDAYAIGRDAFVKLLAEGELISQTPEAILAIGYAELAVQKAAFIKAASEIDPTKPPLEVWDAVQRDHPTAAGLIPDTRAHLEQIRDFIVAKDLVEFPTQQRVIVEQTPTFLRAQTFASMDTPGVFETKATESFYYVTPTEKDWDAKRAEEWLTSFNYYTTDVVSVHEGYPGHFVQALHLMRSDMPKSLKFISSYAFVEGWAHYCEQLAIDEGFPPASLATAPHAGAKYRMAQASEALLRICRLIAAIRMHCQQLTVDQATQFFVDNCYYQPAPARSEARRGTFDPSYCLYTVGKLQMFKLREDYRKQLAAQGKQFNMRAFHNEVLGHGQPPVRLLREYMLTDPATWDATLGR